MGVPGRGEGGRRKGGVTKTGGTRGWGERCGAGDTGWEGDGVSKQGGTHTDMGDPPALTGGPPPPFFTPRRIGKDLSNTFAKLEKLTIREFWGAQGGGLGAQGGVRGVP